MNSSYSSKDEIREMFEKGRDLSKVNCIPPKDCSASENMGRPQRVAVYCRVSTDGIGQTVSFEIQKKYYIKYVKSQPNWKLVGLYSDEGISATTTKNRIGLQMLVRDAKAGKIDLIVIKSISRFCRNLEDSIRIINELKALPRPVGIFFETERISTLDPSMDLIIKVLSMVAEEESKKKSEAIIGSLRARYCEGFFLVYAILGYKRTGVNKISIDEAEAVTVRLIYDMYLAGYTEDQIAEVLIELGRKKHTHRYLDGRVKEGDVDWKASNVRNIFDNEKRCGDVLAQKTYTYDCIEHIVRKNDRKVAQYYGMDQHDAIISREEFYLALRLREANRGGWTKGIQVLKTYVTGSLKGFVRVIPGWYGFEVSDYVAASLKAYGVNIPERPLYPEYVMGSIQDRGTHDGEKDYEEFSHYYAVSDQEFMSEPTITPDEYEQLTEKEPEYLRALIELKDKINSRKSKAKPCQGLARIWQFSMREKKLVTLDRSGISFNYACYEALNADAIEMYYNPVEEKILISKYENTDLNAPEVINWIKVPDGHLSMVRCSAPAICAAIFKCMSWDRENKYSLFGRKILADGKLYLEFSLEYPIVRVRYSKSSPTEERARMDKIEIAMEEAKNTGAFFSENEENPEKYMDYLIGKVDNKSRAVYFLDESINPDTPVSLKEYETEKYNPQFIKTLKEKNINPVEGWDYLNGQIRWFEGGFELYPRLLPTGRIYPSKDEPKESIAQDFGWTTNYSFPTREKVIESIGIERRHICGEGETVSDLCFKAAEKLISKLGWEKESIDLLAFCTQDPDYLNHPNSFVVHDRLEMPNSCMCIDYYHGCPGWVTALSSVSSMIAVSGIKRAILMVGDMCSHDAGKGNREERPLFGDCGTATALEFDENAAPIRFNIITKSAEGKALARTIGGWRNPYTLETLKADLDRREGKVSRDDSVDKMDGMDVFSFAITTVPKTLKQLCSNFGIEMETLDKLVLHQANGMMIKTIAKRMKTDMTKVPMSLKEYGNTTGASIPLTIVSACAEDFKMKQKTMVCGFGTGLACASAYFETDNIVCPEIIIY